MIKKLWIRMEERLDSYKVKKKLLLLYVFCMLIPLFITDSVILFIIFQGESKEQSHEMENVASALQYELNNTFNEAADMSNTIYISRSINEFLENPYASGLDFYTESQDISKKNFYEISFSANTANVVMCSDNDTILNGGHFYRLSSVREEEWYQKLIESGQDMTLHFYYIGDKYPTSNSKRRVSLIRRLNYYKDLKTEKVVRIDLDYNTLARRLNNINYETLFYVCQGDKILFTNDSSVGGNTQNYSNLSGNEKIGYRTEFEVYGEKIQILIDRPKSAILPRIREHFPLVLLMLSVNVLLPLVMMWGINHSFTSRLYQLSEAFEQINAESLKEIDDIRGKDEIGSLMRNYNRMVVRSRELIKTVYKDRLEKQQIDIARQKAELLALHSQINPHFLFNVLESIRMHSILKGEEETAGMIERLAVLERQNVNWKTDYVSIREEIRFIESYLELQKYRFGERLSYQIEVEADCDAYCLPKLTLVTFIENACVHGVEKKAALCRIFLRVYQKEDWLYLEVEDTGNGMEEEKRAALLQRMKNSSLEELKENEHVGVINACLRLRMFSHEKAEFELESEKGIGTMIMIRVPISAWGKGSRGVI